MNKLLVLLGVASVLTACQSVPKVYNGVSGYQVEYKTENSAIFSYTLSHKTAQKLDAVKLQAVCQQILAQDTQYTVQELTRQEVTDVERLRNEQYEVNIGNSKVKFGLMNSPDLYNSQGYATQEMLAKRPQTLLKIRYRCN